jgi:sugar/nucleoside kinase (ribokinase family)
VNDSSIGAPDSQTSPEPALVVVGAATRDIDANDPRGWKLGGGVTYSAMAAAQLGGVRVKALIGADDVAATASELDTLRQVGVEVHLVRLAIGPVFENRRTPTGREQFAHSPSDPIATAALPDDWRAPQGALLAAVAGELHADWAQAFAPSTFVALAAQGLVRRLHAGEEVARLAFEHGPLVRRADAIALSKEDVAVGAPPIRDFLRPGQQLLVTHGKRGSLAITRTAHGITGHYMPPLPLRKAVDPTGAGDTFIAAWLATRLLVEEGSRAQTVASVMSSLVVERTSLHDTPTAADVCDVLIKLRDRQLPGVAGA